MSSQVATLNDNDEGENEDKNFNFDNWVNKWELNEIKYLFKTHNALTVSALNVASTELQGLMVDPELLSNPMYIPKLMKAVQHL